MKIKHANRHLSSHPCMLCTRVERIAHNAPHARIPHPPPSVRRPLPAGPPARVVKIPCGLHNMAKHSALWYLVRASAMLVLPLILPTQSRPLHTQACSHRILTSRCRIFPRPLVETKDLATDESVQTCTMLSLTFTPISLRTVQPQAPRCTVGHRNQLGFATGCCDRRLC